jgi:hypothetical protein
MSEQGLAPQLDPNRGPDDSGLDDPVPVPSDPGGAHAKGYSAEAGAEPPFPDADPIPLATGEPGAILQPERDGQVQPTGRSEPGSYSPNDRLMGSDR